MIEELLWNLIKLPQSILYWCWMFHRSKHQQLVEKKMFKHNDKFLLNSCVYITAFFGRWHWEKILSNFFFLPKRRPNRNEKDLTREMSLTTALINLQVASRSREIFLHPTYVYKARRLITRLFGPWGSNKRTHKKKKMKNIHELLNGYALKIGYSRQIVFRAKEIFHFRARVSIGREGVTTTSYSRLKSKVIVTLRTSKGNEEEEISTSVALRRCGCKLQEMLKSA